MNEFDKEKTNNLILFFGFGMIATGILICFYLAKELLNTYNDFGSNAFFVSLSERLSEKTLFTIGETHPVSIGDGGAGVFALLCLFVLAWTGASIAYVLIKSGAQLLSPAFKSDVESIKVRLNRIMLSIKGQ